jgi:hypothetical protein
MLVINDNAAGSPQTVSLSGTGTVVELSAIGISFGNQPVGTTSPVATVTLTNIYGLTLGITSVTITGTNASDFSQTNSCGVSVPPMKSCTFRVTFTPGASGFRSATLDIFDNGGGSPQIVALSGTGT